MHDLHLILTLASGLTAALVLGFVTQKLKMSPLVGYLLAGVLIGPHSPGYVAHAETAAQFAELGVILLMFGVGLHFHLKDLLAVQKIAVPGALVQILATTAISIGAARFLHWSWQAGLVFGLAISVASTVVLTRVLADNRILHTPTGHTVLGWLVVEDIFTILTLVLLPACLAESGSVWWALGETLLKLSALVAFTLLAGQKLIPRLLMYVARTGTRDLFTLAVLVLALGIAVGSAQFFGASMALGAFLAGMVVGQSDFSARAAAEALPLRDAFAVLFFVSVGMLLDPLALLSNWQLLLCTLAIVLLVKPLAALLVVLLLRRPLRQAITVALALAQIGEFSFILSTLGVSLGILSPDVSNAIIAAAIISITLNPLLIPQIPPLMRWLKRHGMGISPLSPLHGENQTPLPAADRQHIIVVGYGPIGRNVSRILAQNNIDVTVIEMNIDTVQELRNNRDHAVLHGDATQHEVLVHAHADTAQAIILTSNAIPAREVLQAAREINPEIQLLVHTTSLREAQQLHRMNSGVVFSGEGEVALAISIHLMKAFGASAEQIDQECLRIRETLREKEF